MSEQPVSEADLQAYADGKLPEERRTAVAAWLAAHPEDAESDIRFDAVLVAPGRIPRHIPAAFETD